DLRRTTRSRGRDRRVRCIVATPPRPHRPCQEGPRQESSREGDRGRLVRGTIPATPPVPNRNRAARAWMRGLQDHPRRRNLLLQLLLHQLLRTCLDVQCRQGLRPNLLLRLGLSHGEIRESGIALTPAQIHYFYCLRLLHEGWTAGQKQALAAW